MSGRCWRGRGAAAMLVAWVASAGAQQLIDRVVARVGPVALTLTDLKAALGLGVLNAPPEADERAQIQLLVDRQLMLAEVERFAPPEPPEAEIAREVQAMTARAGARLATLMEETGLNEARIRDIARETLRIQGYLNQRFGTTALLSEEDVLQYYRIRPEEFTRDGRLMPFIEAEPVARQRAGAERRAATIAQWLRDLRARANVTINPSRTTS